MNDKQKIASLERSLDLMKKSRDEYMKAYREARQSLPWDWEPPKPLTTSEARLMDVNLLDPGWTKKYDAVHGGTGPHGAKLSDNPHA